MAGAWMAFRSWLERHHGTFPLVFVFFFLTAGYVWVLNDEEDFKRAFDLGATGIMTDYPTKLKEFIEQNNYTTTLK